MKPLVICFACRRGHVPYLSRLATLAPALATLALSLGLATLPTVETHRRRAVCARTHCTAHAVQISVTAVSLPLAVGFFLAADPAV